MVSSMIYFFFKLQAQHHEPRIICTSVIKWIKSRGKKGNMDGEIRIKSHATFEDLHHVTWQGCCWAPSTDTKERERPGKIPSGLAYCTRGGFKSWCWVKREGFTERNPWLCQQTTPASTRQEAGKKWKDLVSLSIIRLFTEKKNERLSGVWHTKLSQNPMSKKDALDRLADIKLLNTLKEL